MFAGVVDDFGAGAFGRRGGQWPVQEPQSCLAVITAGGAKLVEDARLVRPTGALIAAVAAGEGLTFGGEAHVRWLGYHEYEST